MKVEIHPSWKNLLQEEFSKPYFKDINSKLIQDHEAGNTIYPKGSELFNAYNSTPVDKVKVVILGQDPYHGENQAHGLSFSVRKGIKIPPSLQNIYKELHNDLGIQIPPHGELTKWANQGVLLLNSILTVRAHQPASHRKIGWEQFTDATIKKLSSHKQNVVFMLWGNFAKNKQYLIQTNNYHLVLKASHPSPFSVHKGFFGTRHFSKANIFLQQHGMSAIHWQIKD